MSATVDALYAAAVGQIDWHAALDRVLDTMGYTHASVYATDRHVKAVATDNFRLPVSGFWHRHDPASQRAYETEFYKHEPGRHYFLRNPGTRVRHDLMFATETDMDRSPFYDWAQREADLRYIVVGQTNPDLPVGAALSLQRPRRHGPTTSDEVIRLRRLLDHFERAVQVEFHMGKALGPGVASLDFLERNPTGVVILDGLGRVVLANSAARGLAERADAFVLRSDGIAALRSGDDRALQQMIGAAARTTRGGSLSSGGVLRLPRRTGQRAYALSVAPLSRRESILSDLTPAACVLITDPEAVRAPSAIMLRNGYGVTAAEARLVERLVAGDTPQQAAQALGLAMPTVRNQLAAVFRKTETDRQSELVRLLVSLPWWQGPDGGRG